MFLTPIFIWKILENVSRCLISSTSGEEIEVEPFALVGCYTA